jgi:hypothetical protein
MLRFVSIVNFEGLLLALTEGGAVWQFHPTQIPMWNKISDGPLHAQGVD